jgi:hypothetical protein
MPRSRLFGTHTTAVAKGCERTEWTAEKRCHVNLNALWSSAVRCSAKAGADLRGDSRSPWPQVG